MKKKFKNKIVINIKTYKMKIIKAKTKKNFKFKMKHNHK